MEKMLFSIILTSYLLAAATAVGEVDTDLEGEILEIDPLSTTSANYIGVTYDLLRGNPDGQAVTLGGADPGIHTNNHVFKLTYTGNNKSPDMRYIIADQMDFSGAHSCYESNSEFMYVGSRSYQKKFGVDVSMTSGVEVPGLAKAEFSLSANYQKVDSGSKTFEHMYFEINRRCNYGKAKYRHELAGEKNYPLADTFVVDSCQLPVSFDSTKYMRFLKKYGTHIIVAATMGSKLVHRRTITAVQAMTYASNEVGFGTKVSAGLTFKGVGVSSSRSLNMRAFWSSTKKDKIFTGSNTTFVLGKEAHPEPIHLDLMELHRVYEDKYWKLSEQYVNDFEACTQEWMDNRKQIYVNVLTALTRYPAFSHASIPSDPVPSVPLTWPQGQWTLPGFTNGACPFSGQSEFKFEKGSWRHYGRPKSSSPSKASDWPGGKLPTHPDNWIHHFCTKKVKNADIYAWGWPRGKYCIYRYGDCPNGMESGGVGFYDRTWPQWNTIGGSVHPRSKLGKTETNLDYCCSTKGHTGQPIALPIEEPFMLLPLSGQPCQKVENMKVRHLEFSYRNWRNPWRWGSVPVEIAGDRAKLRYCYYYSDC